MCPPSIPTDNHAEDFYAVPCASLHNFPLNNDGTQKPIASISPSIINTDEQMRSPSQFSKKRLISEVHKFLIDKPPIPYKPSVMFTYNNQRFIQDIEYRINKFGYLHISTGSSLKDIQNSFNNGLNWALTKTNPIFNLTSMIFHSKKHEIQELKTIPPPLLMIYLGIEKALAEDFVETFTIKTSDNKLISGGCIIPILDYRNNDAIHAWLDPNQISATKIQSIVLQMFLFYFFIIIFFIYCFLLEYEKHKSTIDEFLGK